MKNPLLSISIFLFAIASATPLIAQKNFYRTVKVRGDITLIASGKHLYTDKKFKTGEALLFGSVKDCVVVIDDQSSAFLLVPDTTLRHYKRIPIPLGVGTRAGYILSDLQLRQYFEQNDSLLLLNGRFSLLLGAKTFPMDEGHFFYLQYTWKGDTINKKLGFSGDTLIIAEKEVYKVDGQAIDPSEVSGDFFLRYFIADKQESIAYPDLWRPVHLINMPEADITAEVRVLLDEGEKQPFEEQLKSVSNYLALFYGRAGALELEHWLKELNH